MGGPTTVQGRPPQTTRGTSVGAVARLGSTPDVTAPPLCEAFPDQRRDPLAGRVASERGTDMKQLLLAAVVLGGIAIAVRVALGGFPALMERMMENVMPGMMDRCFSGMDRERREYMLRHCRGLLDQMEAKYVQPARDDAAESETGH